ncbi:hypothetical protein BC940DRAFT_348675 [Gongronella butleri]|nr:hypothetical protein BC940DRAFT_348675 [Gongronella butleri]
MSPARKTGGTRGGKKSAVARQSSPAKQVTKRTSTRAKKYHSREKKAKEDVVNSNRASDEEEVLVLTQEKQPAQTNIDELPRSTGETDSESSESDESIIRTPIMRRKKRVLDEDEPDLVMVPPRRLNQLDASPNEPDDSQNAEKSQQSSSPRSMRMSTGSPSIKRARATVGRDPSTRRIYYEPTVSIPIISPGPRSFERKQKGPQSPNTAAQERVGAIHRPSTSSGSISATITSEPKRATKTNLNSMQVRRKAPVPVLDFEWSIPVDNPTFSTPHDKSSNASSSHASRTAFSSSNIIHPSQPIQQQAFTKLGEFSSNPPELSTSPPVSSSSTPKRNTRTFFSPAGPTSIYTTQERRIPLAASRPALIERLIARADSPNPILTPEKELTVNGRELLNRQVGRLFVNACKPLPHHIEKVVRRVYGPGNLTRDKLATEISKARLMLADMKDAFQYHITNYLDDHLLLGATDLLDNYEHILKQEFLSPAALKTIWFDGDDHHQDFDILVKCKPNAHSTLVQVTREFLRLRYEQLHDKISDAAYQRGMAQLENFGNPGGSTRDFFPMDHRNFPLTVAEADDWRSNEQMTCL